MAELVGVENATLLDWPQHWDQPIPTHEFGIVAPAERKLFRERLKVMLRVLANTFEHKGFDSADEVRDRLYHSRSARIAAAVEAARLTDEELSELFRLEGASHLANFPSVEAPADVCLEGLVPYGYADDGHFLHVERQVAAYAVGLRRLDHALGDIM